MRVIDWEGRVGRGWVGGEWADWLENGWGRLCFGRVQTNWGGLVIIDS